MLNMANNFIGLKKLAQSKKLLGEASILVKKAKMRNDGLLLLQAAVERKLRKFKDAESFIIKIFGSTYESEILNA